MMTNIKNPPSGIKLLLAIAALMWLIQLINVLTNYSLSGFGIVPREPMHLFGIIAAPLLHGSLFHIISNTLPFIVLGFLVHQAKQLMFVTLFVWLVGGLLVWLFARGSIHVGASGVVMGYFGFLVSHAFFTRSLRSIVVTAAAVLLYGGIVITLLDF
ncbi:MAG: membrane associated rhomboid family serine protease, partial [Phenylobacterium sp.]